MLIFVSATKPLAMTTPKLDKCFCHCFDCDNIKGSNSLLQSFKY